MNSFSNCNVNVIVTQAAASTWNKISYHTDYCVLTKSPDRLVKIYFNRGVNFLPYQFFPFPSSANSPFCHWERGFVPKVSPKSKSTL